MAVSGEVRTIRPRVQRAGPGDRQGVWRRFTVGDGFPVDITHDMLQDRQGRLWFATYRNGVCCYDGRHVLVYGPDEGFPHRWVQCLLEDRHGNLWFGTAGAGLTRYDGEVFETFKREHGLPSDWVSALAEDGDGTIWIGTANFFGRDDGAGVSRFTGDGFESLTAADGLGGSNVRVITIDRSGRAWLATEAGDDTEAGGVVYWEDGHLSAIDPAVGAWSDSITTIFEDRHASLWFGCSQHGVSRLDGDGLHTLSTRDGLAHDSIFCIAEDRDGQLWIGTRGEGVSRFDGERFVSFTIGDGLANNQVSSIVEDREGYLWFATWSGISRYDQVTMKTWTRREGMPSDFAMRVLADHCGRLFVGTAAREAGSSVVSIEATGPMPVVGLGEQTIWAACRDAEGRLWWGTIGGRVLCQDGSQVHDHTAAIGVAPDAVMSIAQADDGAMWIGSEWTGVCRLDGAQTESWTDADGLPHVCVQSLMADGEGGMWLGTYAGLCRYRNGRMQAADFDTEALRSPVTSMFRDHRGRLWFGTYRGAVCVDGEKVTNLSIGSGLPHDMVMKIAEDRRGVLWFATFGGGVGCFDGLVSQSLTTRDGLGLDAVQDLHADDAGDMWIATEGGLTRYRYTARPPTVEITGVIADRQYDPTGEIRITTSQKLVVFEFVGGSHTTRPEALAYVCQLTNVDDAWRPVYEGRISYTELSIGEYEFRVCAVDRDFNYSEPAVVQLVVEADAHLRALTDALNASSTAGGGGFVGESRVLRQAQERIAQVAATDVTVLILGETGTGKGLAALGIHRLSQRPSGDTRVPLSKQIGTATSRSQPNCSPRLVEGDHALWRAHGLEVVAGRQDTSVPPAPCQDSATGSGSAHRWHSHS